MINRQMINQVANGFKAQNQLNCQQPFYRDRHLNTLLIVLTLLSLIATLASYLCFGYHAFFHEINHLAYHWPDWVSQLLTICGDTGVALIFVFVLARGDQRMIWLTVVAAIIAALMVHILGKEIFQTFRPAGVLAEGSFHLTGNALKMGSFPSGHTATIFTCMAVLAYKYTGTGQRLFMLVFAIVVGLSRVWVGAHWPIDIMASAALGIFSAVLANQFCLRFTGGMHVKPQAIFLLILLINSLSLFFYDTDYAKVQPMVWLLAALSLVYALYQYVIIPLSNK